MRFRDVNYEINITSNERKLIEKLFFQLYSCFFEINQKLIFAKFSKIDKIMNITTLKTFLKINLKNVIKLSKQTKKMIKTYLKNENIINKFFVLIVKFFNFEFEIIIIVQHIRYLNMFVNTQIIIEKLIRRKFVATIIIVNNET